jgi:hypothetical protein
LYSTGGKKRKNGWVRAEDIDSTMDYSTMSLIELKRTAKGRGLKLYYILPKDELVRLLSLPELPLELRLQKKTIRQLRQEAKAKNLTGFWGLSRGELLALLYPNEQGAANKNQKNQCDADEHDDPQNHRP